MHAGNYVVRQPLSDNAEEELCPICQGKYLYI